MFIVKGDVCQICESYKIGDSGPDWPINTWLGVTAENQEVADKRILILVSLPVAIRFVSIEPMLGPIDLSRWINRLDWVICGGETGPDPGVRPMHPDWVRSIRDQCKKADVPFFFKQWGKWEPFYDRDRDDPGRREVPAGKGRGVRCMNLAGGHGFHGERVCYFKMIRWDYGHLLDNREPREFPERRMA